MTETTTLKPFIISREFNAPVETVWQAWTDPGHMGWWGPKGVTIERPRLDLRPGGLFHYCMKTPDGHAMWGRWIIREVTPPQRLVFVNSFSDEAAGITRHPMNPAWPGEVLSTITFESQTGGTLLTIQWEPLNPTAEERAAFDSGHEGMKGGWSGSLDRLEEHLAGTA